MKVRVTLARPSLVVVKVTRSVPKKLERIEAAVALKVLCPELYDGKGGVAISGDQPASASVSGLPSAAAFRIAVIGRSRRWRRRRGRH